MLNVAVVEDSRADGDLLSSYIERIGKENGTEYKVFRFTSAEAFLDAFFFGGICP